MRSLGSFRRDLGFDSVCSRLLAIVRAFSQQVSMNTRKFSTRARIHLPISPNRIDFQTKAEKDSRTQ
jgi:hypothetical protein